MTDHVTIRTATADDAILVAKLVAQLGYEDITIEAARRRLVQILDRVDHAVYVAVSDRRVVRIPAYLRDRDTRARAAR